MIVGNPVYIRSEWYSFYGGPLTSARMAHLCFNILQPVLNLLRFWFLVGNLGFKPRSPFGRRIYSNQEKKLRKEY